MLTIIIPTYNRSEYLDKNLELLCQLSKIYKFSLIICNNGSTDNTLSIIDKWRKFMPFIVLVSHENNIGYDKNVSSAYQLVKTKYVWLLGDSYRFNVSAFSMIIKQLASNVDLLIINVRRNSIDSGIIQITPEELLKEYGWYLTHLSSFIMKSEFINEYSLIRYISTNFIHLGVLFEGIAHLKICNIRYLREFVVDTIPLNIDKDKKSGSWRSNPFPIFGAYWFHTIMSLPNSYSHESKLECIKKHDEFTRALSVRNLLRVILYGHRSDLNYKILRKYIPFVCASAAWKYDLAMCFCPSIPISLLKFRKKILNIK